jgi:hypothetical protein
MFTRCPGCGFPRVVRPDRGLCDRCFMHYSVGKCTLCDNALRSGGFHCVEDSGIDRSRDAAVRAAWKFMNRHMKLMRARIHTAMSNHDKYRHLRV